MEAVADVIKFKIPLGKIIESDDPTVCGGFGPYPRKVIDMAREILTNFEYEVFAPESYGEKIAYFADVENEDGGNIISQAMSYYSKIIEVPIVDKKAETQRITNFLILIHSDPEIFLKNDIYKNLIFHTSYGFLTEKNADVEAQKDIDALNEGKALSVYSNFRDPIFRRYIFRASPKHKGGMYEYFLVASLEFLYRGFINFKDGVTHEATLKSLIADFKKMGEPVFLGWGDYAAMHKYILKHDRIPPLEEAMLRMAYGHDVCVIVGDEKAMS